MRAAEGGSGIIRPWAATPARVPGIIPERVAREEGYNAIAYGANVDDMSDWRPGHQAARERSVRSPLYEAGMTKPEIREAARMMGLPNWNKPAMACLSSRIPYLSDVTNEKLRMIERAEDAVRGLGFRICRVRAQR